MGANLMIDIADAHLLTDLFGHWPDFHDAEILALRLQTSRADGLSIEADLEIAEMSSEVELVGGPWGKPRYRVCFVPIAGFCEVEIFCDAVTVITARATLRENQ